MTTKELIKQLSNYPSDTKISNINFVSRSTSEEIFLSYIESPEEIKARKQCILDAQIRHQEDQDRRGEITSFANRW